MQERNLRVLEFTKIRAMLKEHAVSELGRERIDQLVPSADAETVRKWQQETDEAGIHKSRKTVQQHLWHLPVL